MNPNLISSRESEANLGLVRGAERYDKEIEVQTRREKIISSVTRAKQMWSWNRLISS